MLKISVVTLFPAMFVALTDYGVNSRAIQNGHLSLDFWDPKNYTDDKHRTVDDRSYGGGPGMVLMYEPVVKAIQQAKAKQLGAKVIYMSPQGRRLDQAAIMDLAEQQSFIIVSGRYEGIDQRIIDAHVDQQWSIGDYVLSGGELPAMVLIDSICRIQVGVLGNEESAKQDSFMNGLLDYPHYTRPETIDNMSVPEVLLSGDHAAISRWRMQQAIATTQKQRPDLLDDAILSNEQQELLKQ